VEWRIEHPERQFPKTETNKSRLYSEERKRQSEPIHMIRSRFEASAFKAVMSESDQYQQQWCATDPD
jgi:hypothetical protein